jgi:hypothetical protein
MYWHDDFVVHVAQIEFIDSSEAPNSISSFYRKCKMMGSLYSEDGTLTERKKCCRP